MDETYWEEIFSSFRKAIEHEGRTLPSLSLIAEEKQDPFRVLIATILSLRTKDDVTLSSSRRLFALADTPEAMLGLSTDEIERAIYPAGFYKTKAKTLQSISRELLASYGGEVPSTSEALMKLPGVGIKTANLTLNLGFGIEAICVDCHVHKIANRMGWVETKTPERTEIALQGVMPRRFWIPLNELLVIYGQLICTSVSPWCSKCPQQQSCPKHGVSRSR
ncbi:endonuclease III [Sphaerochaeta sp. PS]|uniref:endonuclease III domain-containing protein n=1 Tax=Sphaerochaeta sp. PS TaxID=3076336 RepID=UPI0028A428CB|nr:endonuclease III [Sphaerochaeta sp. PS]MDT4762490.1 endonuclease III [Sphaerochaeta sp. PS]